MVMPNKWIQGHIRITKSEFKFLPTLILNMVTVGYMAFVPFRKGFTIAGLVRQRVARGVKWGQADSSSLNEPLYSPMSSDSPMNSWTLDMTGSAWMTQTLLRLEAFHRQLLTTGSVILLGAANKSTFHLSSPSPLCVSELGILTYFSPLSWLEILLPVLKTRVHWFVGALLILSIPKCCQGKTEKLSL